MPADTDSGDDVSNSETLVLKRGKGNYYLTKAFDNLSYDNQQESSDRGADTSLSSEIVLKNYRRIFLYCIQKIDNKLLNSKNIKEFRYYLDNDLKKEIIKKEKEIRQAFGKVKCKQCGKCCKLAVSEFDHKTLLDKAKNGDITAKSFLEVFEPYPNNLLPDEVFGFYPALNLQPCSANNLQNGFQDDGLASPQNHRQNNLHCDLQSNAQDSQQPGLDNCAESNFADSQQNDGQSCCADELCYFYRCNKVKTLNGAYFCPIYTKRPSVCRNFPDTPLENLPNGCAYIEWKKENTEKALYIKALNDIRKHYLKMIQNMMTK